MVDTRSRLEKGPEWGANEDVQLNPDSIANVCSSRWFLLILFFQSYWYPIGLLGRGSLTFAPLMRNGRAYMGETIIKLDSHVMVTHTRTSSFNNLLQNITYLVDERCFVSMFLVSVQVFCSRCNNAFLFVFSWYLTMKDTGVVNIWYNIYRS